MTKKKNALFTILAMLLIFSMLLTACGGADEPVDTADTASEDTADTAEMDTEEEAAEPEEVEEAAEPVTISLWAMATVTESGPPPDDWVAYDILRDMGIELEYTIIPPGNDGEAKVNAAAAANDLPDIFQIVSETNVRDPLYRYYELGLLSPVGDMLDMMPVRTENYYNNQTLLDLVTFDGELYGLPQPPIIPKREGFVIRQDWLDNLGLEAPTTPEELMEVAMAFTSEDPDGNGADDTYGIGAFVQGPGVGRRFNFVFGPYGVVDVWNFVDADNFGLNVRDPQYYEAMELMVNLQSAGVIDPDWPVLTKDEFRARWKQGKFGIMWEDFAALTNKSNYAPFDENFPEGSWTPLPMITGPEGEAYYGINEANFNLFAVSASAADEGKKEAIARFLEWVATDGYYLLGFGVEGENFNLDENGYLTLDGIEPEMAYNAAERQPYTQLRNQLVFYNSLAEVSARYPNYTTEVSGRDMTPIDTFLTFFQSQDWVEGAVKKLITPPDNAADFDTFYNEGIINFAVGNTELTPEAWAEFLAGLDTLGAVEYEQNAIDTLVGAGLLPEQ